MSLTTIGVLRGGPSPEHDVSLKTGSTVLSSLPESRYRTLDIWIDRSGTWHMHGKSRTPGRILEHVDVVYNALHGTYGEDGTVQHILAQFGVPYTGSDAFAAACAMQKHLAKDMCADAGLLVPPGVVVRPDDDTEAAIQEAAEQFEGPYVVKPANAGSSIGIEIAQGRFALRYAVERLRSAVDTVLIEPQLRGREATCGVIDAFRGEERYALLPVEIEPSAEHTFFDYDAKYGGASTERCPGRFTRTESDALQDAARKAHDVLGMSHYSRSDFIITDESIYLLETNALPGLTGGSLMPLALDAVGGTLEEFLDHTILLARNRKGARVGL